VQAVSERASVRPFVKASARASEKVPEMDPARAFLPAPQPLPVDPLQFHNNHIPVFRMRGQILEVHRRRGISVLQSDSYIFSFFACNNSDSTVLIIPWTGRE
jgi:hypothetical protein